MSGLEKTVLVQVPGSLIATYSLDTNEIVGWTFSPHGSLAGYFGPSANPVTDHDGVNLDVENTDGLFWRAVQEHLAERVVDDDDSAYVRTVFSVSWEE
jgi:hypothetical protein